MPQTIQQPTAVRRQSARYSKRRRSGTATVEMAVVLPVFFVMLFGSLEVCHRLFTRQSVTIIAYEAARLATRQTSDTATVEARATELLSQHNISGATVQIRDITNSQNNLDDIATGDEIRVRITVPWAQNVVSRRVLNDQGTFQVQAFMLRE